MHSSQRGVLLPLVMSLGSLGSLGALGLTCRCEDVPPAQGDARVDDGALPDARFPDAQVPDVGTDADLPPDAIQHDFCNEPFFKLPIDGQSERTIGIAVQGGRMVWSKQKEHASSLGGEIYLLDLSTCIERRITSGSKASGVDVHGDLVVWDDYKDDPHVWGSELYSYEIGNGQQERLTETSQVEMDPKTNGRFVAYRRMETINDPPGLRLLDLQTGDDTELSPPWTNIESFDIGDRWVVWVAYTQDPQSTGRDVFYHDLTEGETHHIDATYDRYQYWTFLWEDWITIEGSDAHLTRPTFLSLHNLLTHETRSLVEGDFATSCGVIGNGLVSWNTSYYSGTTQLNPSDLELYDISSGLSRRLTTEAGFLRVWDLLPPYQLFVRRLFLYDMFMNDYYIANLEALGVIDGSGALIPGDPVITPP